MRFLMPTTFYPPAAFGGDGIAVQRLARALVSRGHSVTVVHDVDAFEMLRGEGPMDLLPRSNEDGVEVLRLRSRLGRLGPLLVHQLGHPVVHARRLRRLVADGTWDVVHFHNVSLIGGPGILRYPREATTVYTAHEHWLVCPTHVLWRHDREPCPSRQCLRCTLAHHRPPQLWRYTGLLPRALKQVDLLLAMSEFSRDKHREFGLHHPMKVLPPFLPEEPAEVHDEIDAHLPHPRPYFLYVGRLELLKGVDDLLEAFRSFREADLLVIGSGSAGPDLRAAAHGLPHVHFLGAIDHSQLRAYYRHATATVVPSRGFETFGLVLIESFREGTPVIARRIGPFPETVALAGGGVMFDTVAELRAALHTIQSQAGARRRLGTAAREAFRQRWTEEAVLPAYLDLVEQAVTRRQSQPRTG